VLAHSLRDAGTTKKLAILVTLDTVSENVVTQLRVSSLGNSPAHSDRGTNNSSQTVYDYIIPVDRIQNGHPANLDLMNRPDLHSAFTKINLWKQTQFRKIVYVDADIVAYRAPDELFNLDHAFSAAPDIGWPDLFNSGVMVLTPNMGDYYAMMAMAQRGISFDGADQGLLNMYFKEDFNRLSFSYNVTPSAHYQYIPAYTHFQSSISMVHFIGSNKPWIQGRDVSAGGSPFDQMVGRWWAVYDRHYRKGVRTNAPP
jgi:alpha-N-acetylglucosamine transferase